MPFQLAFSSAFLTVIFTLVTAQTCYYPNGDASPDTPCNSSAEHSACCNPLDTCLANSLCFQPGTWGGITARASCTDQTWTSGACSPYCRDVVPSGGFPIIPVLQPSNSYFLFCCGVGYNETTNECNHTTNNDPTPFLVPPGKPIFNRTDGSTDPNITTSNISTIVTATPSGSSTDNNHDVAIGAGVGVPLGLALIAALGMIWMERRQRKILMRRLDSAQGDRKEQFEGSNPQEYTTERISELQNLTSSYELQSTHLGELGDNRA